VLLFELEEGQIAVEERRANLGVTVEVKIVQGDVFLVTQ
jgi:hypothetical protein